jgi:uncharacterized protein YukE
MAQFTGMDIAEVRALAAQLTRASEEINQLAATLTSRLEGTPWVGPDRERFVSEWHGQYKTNLTSIANALQGASQAATQNAQAQEDVSNS